MDKPLHADPTNSIHAYFNSMQYLNFIPLFCSTAPVDHGRVLNLSFLIHCDIPIYYSYLDTCMYRWYNYSSSIEIFFQISSIQLVFSLPKKLLFLLTEMPLNSTFLVSIFKKFPGGGGGMPPDPLVSACMLVHTP